MEITLENVELVKDRTGVTYKEAKEALEANDGNVVDAIIAIESAIEAGNKSWVKEDATLVVDKIKAAVKKGNVSKIVISKDDDVLLNLPLNISIIGAVIAPWAAVAGVIAAFGTKCKIALVRDDGEVVDVNGKALDSLEAAKAKSAEVVNKVKMTGKVTDYADKAKDYADKAKEYVDKAIDFGGDLVNQIKDKLNIDEKPEEPADVPAEEPDDTPKN